MKKPKFQAEQFELPLQQRGAIESLNVASKDTKLDETHQKAAQTYPKSYKK